MRWGDEVRTARRSASVKFLWLRKTRARTREGHHDDPLGFFAGGGIAQGHASEADAEIGQRGDFQLQLVMVGERVLVKFFLFSHRGTEDTERERKEEAQSPVADGWRAA
jgi:hypothetical protein